MALLIKYVPIDYPSFNDDIVYTVLDTTAIADPVTYANFKYIGDVYVNGTLVARVKKIPNPATGVGIFNVGQIVRNYVATTFNPTQGQLVAQELGVGEFSVSVEMHFGEEYGYTDYLDITIDIERIFFNNYNGRGGGANSSLVLFTDLVASNRPLVNQVLYSSGFSLIPYFPTATTPVLFQVIPNVGISYTDSFVPNNAYDMQILNVSPTNLNLLQPGTITPATTSYTVQIAGQIYTFNVICEPIYTPNTLHFLNKLGGFDSKIFTKVSRYSVSTTRNNYSKLPYTVDADGNVEYNNTNRVYNEKTSVYNIQYKEKKVFNSDLLSDEEYSWLEDLILSPMVYLEEANGDFFPVQVSDNNYEVNKVQNGDFTNLTITVEYGQTLNSQFR